MADSAAVQTRTAEAGRESRKSAEASARPDASGFVSAQQAHAPAALAAPSGDQDVVVTGSRVRRNELAEARASPGPCAGSVASDLTRCRPALGQGRNPFATAYRQFLGSPIDLAPVADSLLSGLLWALVLGTTAAWWFGRKDVSG